MDTLPDITVIIPVYNAANELIRCLHSLRTQDYPQDRLHILVVDDDSTDDTVIISATGGASVLRNGHRSIERGKSIGLAHTQTELVLFLDSDNRLPARDWLRCAVTALVDHPDVVGVQAARFSYNPKDPPANRYCSLFGIGDPVAYYFRKHDHLSRLDTDWTLSGTVVAHHADYFLVRFRPETMPTIGSQGFLTRKSLLLQTNWTPLLFHVDSNLELVASGHNLYAMLRREVVHDYVRSTAHLCRKLRRNGMLFFSQQSERAHVWPRNPWTVAFCVLKMMSVVLPMRDALRGYGKVRDPAWFLHPVLCVYVPTLYAFLYTRWRVQRKGGTGERAAR
jgi:glycosyltransferase involved in cell wall biosynthesis